MKLKPINAVYVMHAIEGIAGSLIGIFIPIYLLGLHYGLREIFTYFLFYSIFVLIFFALASYLSDRFGLKTTLLIRLPFLFLYMWLLYSLADIKLPLYWLAIVNALQVALYWFPLHVIFIEHSKEKHLGHNIGKLMAFAGTAGLFAPIAGASITIIFGFKYLILGVWLIFALSFIPIIITGKLDLKTTFKFGNFFHIFRNNKKYFLIEIVENLREEVEGIIWPIFIFLLLRDVLSIGIVGSMFSVGGIVFTYLVGRHSDKANKKMLMKIGAFIMILVWIIRFYADHWLVLFLLTAFAGFFESLLVVPFSAIAFKLAKQHEVAEFIIFREIPVAIGRIFIYSMAIIFATNIEYTFIITAILNLFFFFY